MLKLITFTRTVYKNINVLRTHMYIHNNIMLLSLYSYSDFHLHDCMYVLCIIHNLRLRPFMVRVESILQYGHLIKCVHVLYIVY